MKRPIPEQIVAALNVLAESLASWCEEGRDGRLGATTDYREAAELLGELTGLAVAPRDDPPRVRAEGDGDPRR